MYSRAYVDYSPDTLLHFITFTVLYCHVKSDHSSEIFRKLQIYGYFSILLEVLWLASKTSSVGNVTNAFQRCKVKLFQPQLNL